MYALQYANFASALYNTYLHICIKISTYVGMHSTRNGYNGSVQVKDEGQIYSIPKGQTDELLLLTVRKKLYPGRRNKGAGRQRQLVTAE